MIRHNSSAIANPDAQNQWATNGVNATYSKRGGYVVLWLFLPDRNPFRIDNHISSILVEIYVFVLNVYLIYFVTKGFCTALDMHIMYTLYITDSLYYFTVVLYIYVAFQKVVYNFCTEFFKYNKDKQMFAINTFRPKEWEGHDCNQFVRTW